MDDLWQLGLVAGLVVLNAVFAGSELALVSLRPGQIDRMEKRGGGGRAVARLASDPNRYLATIQIGITLAGFLASATAAVSLAQPLVPVFEDLFGDAAEVLAIMVVTLLLTFVTLVFGELAPKRIAMQHPEGWALTVGRPLNVLATAARPAVWLLSTSTNLLVGILGGDPNRQREEVTEEEIRDMVAAQMSLTPEERQVIAGALDVGDRSLRQILVPRQAIFALPASMPVAQALPLIVEAAHSRVPIYAGTPDSVVGVVQLRQLFGQDGVLGDLGSPVLTFPESASVLSALRTMQKERQQMALVVDEYGGLEGLVTTEDLVEEIVGEIYDEDDRDVAAIVREADGSVTLPGSFPVHDLIDLGIGVPEGRYSTVAGLLLERLGRIPTTGESVHIEEWHFTVVGMENATITQVHVGRSTEAAAPDVDDRATADA